MKKSKYHIVYIPKDSDELKSIAIDSHDELIDHLGTLPENKDYHIIYGVIHNDIQSLLGLDDKAMKLIETMQKASRKDKDGR